MKKIFDRFRKKSSHGEQIELPEEESGPQMEVLEGKIVERTSEHTVDRTVLNVGQTGGTPTPEPETPSAPPLEEPTQAFEPPPEEQQPEAAPEPTNEGTRTRLTRILKGKHVQQIPAVIANLDYREFAERMTRIAQGRGYAFYGKILTIMLCAFFLADVIALLVGSRIPEPPTPRPSFALKKPRSLEDFNIVMTRNLFNHKGLIPGEETQAPGFDPGGAPVKSTLPLNLLGTVILRDERRSIATIEDKSASMVYPIRVDEEIPGKARIVKIEPTRVIFVNIQANHREYIELPEDLIMRKSVGVANGPATPGIEQVASNQFNIDRKEVDKALSDLNNILTQARAVPNFENGVASGYKLFQIVPHSIYDQLGLKNGDVIAGLDGQPVNDPGKAFELLNSLKTRSSLELQIKRDGKSQTFSYEIH
ncbi:MAG: type II secretion system protein GspC [Oligoflexia bacterium]|nr:type II secretion system protein GspC [Oligoflexia bacterium]